MAHKIPKLQYLNTTLSGTTSSGSPTITGISSTADLQAGMKAVGTGIPVGATILSLTSTTATLSANATASATVSIAYYFEISFDYPPIEVKGEILDAKERVSVSISGLRQVSLDHIEGQRKMKFSFVSQTIKDLVTTFFTTHALYGKVFRYFDDNTSMSYVEYELLNFKYDPTKISPRGPSAYLWEFPLDVRRVL